MLKDNSSLGADAQHPSRGIGHYDHLLRRRERVLRSASPAAAARIRGERPTYANAQVYKINVNLKTGERTVERVEPARRPPRPDPPAIAALPEPNPVDTRMIVVRPRALTARNIVECVAEAWGIRPEHLISAGRRYAVSRPRAACYRLMKQWLRMSFPHIGQWLGKRDHSSALHGYRRSFLFYETLPDWRARYDAVIHAFGLEGREPPEPSVGTTFGLHLSADQIESICRSSAPQKVLAARHGVSQSTISRIKGGRNSRSRAGAEPARGGGGACAESQPASGPAAARHEVSA